jgi:hypothetical protein
MGLARVRLRPNMTRPKTQAWNPGRVWSGQYLAGEIRCLLFDTNFTNCHELDFLKFV